MALCASETVVQPTIVNYCVSTAKDATFAKWAANGAEVACPVRSSAALHRILFQKHDAWFTRVRWHSRCTCSVQAARRIVRSSNTARQDHGDLNWKFLL